MSRYRWKQFPVLPLERLTREKDISPLLVQLLHNRGIVNPLQYEAFLSADKRLSNDPFLLPDINLAINRVLQAISNDEEIVVYGDFDADGVTSTVLLVEGLRLLGAKVRAYIPHREKEGYGLNSDALTLLRSQGVGLVITVDCGASSVNEVSKARQTGLDIIITDHHSIIDDLPPAVANINPKRSDSKYPYNNLAGVGVAFRLLQAIFLRKGLILPEDKFLGLVAIGTVADVVPLLQENRFLTKQGLQSLCVTTRPGIKALMKRARLKASTLCADDIAWSLGPRINSSGRLEHAILSYNLLQTSSNEEATELAGQLESMNSRRQRLTEDVLNTAKQKLPLLAHKCRHIMIDGEFPVGIIGIVAGRLANEYYRPVFVLNKGMNISRGSCRSIPEFDIMDALKECHDLFIRFGGHSMAAGFTLPTHNIDLLNERLKKIMEEKLGNADLRPGLVIDAPINLAKLNGQTYENIQRLSPFGEGNPLPVFISRKVRVTDHRRIGQQGEHIEMKVRVDKTRWRGIGFGSGNRASEISPLIDIVYTLGLDNWSENPLIKLNILDFEPCR